MTYEKQNLEDIVDEWNDWTKYEKKFNDKNGPGPADSELRLKVGRKWNRILPKQPENYFIEKPNDILHKYILDGKGMYEKAVVEYTEDNLDSILKEASGDSKGLYSLAVSLPKHKTGHTGNDKIRDLVQEINDMENAIKQQNIGYMQKYIMSSPEVGGNEYIQSAIAYGIANSPEDTMQIFSGFYHEKAKELQDRFSSDNSEKRELSKSKLGVYIREMINYLKKEESIETDKDKSDKLRDEIKAIYGSLAQVAYQVIKED